MTALWDDPGIARAMHQQDELLEERLAGGARLLGWKLGLGAPATMQQVGLSAPLVGFLTTATQLPSGAMVDVGGWTRPMLEPEIALVLAADVPAGADAGQALAAVGGLAPAIELADVDRPLEDLAEIVAGDIFHRHVLLGPTTPVDGSLPALKVRVRKDGLQVGATDDPEAATGSVGSLLAHVAGWLQQLGRRLEAGHVVIAGSTTPLVPVAPGETVDYDCDPLGHVTVTFR